MGEGTVWDSVVSGVTGTEIYSAQPSPSPHSWGSGPTGSRWVCSPEISGILQGDTPRSSPADATMKDPQPGEGMELDPWVRLLLLSSPPRTFLSTSLLQWSLPHLTLVLSSINSDLSFWALGCLVVTHSSCFPVTS